MSNLSHGLIWGDAKNPIVTVVVTCHNQAAFIGAALRSVAEQSYVDFVCVVVDDKSTDASVSHINDMLNELDDRRFQLICHDRNQGQMAAMLSGADTVVSPFIAFIDGDDVWHPDFLSCHVSAHLGRLGNASISCSDMALIDGRDAVLTGNHPVFRRSDPRQKDCLAETVNVFGEGDETLVYVPPGHFGWLWSGTSAMVFRRAIIDLLRPGATDDIRVCADEYWAHAAQIVGGTVRLQRRLGYYRLHDDNGWANSVYLGEGFELGVVDREAAGRIHLILAKQFCAKVDEITKYVPKKHVAAALLRMLGEGALRRLCARDKQAYELLWASLPGPDDTATKNNPVN